MRALQRHASQPKRPALFTGPASSLCPDLDIVTQSGARPGDFFHEGGDPSPHWIKFVGDQKYRRSRGGGGHAWRFRMMRTGARLAELGGANENWQETRWGCP